MPQLDVTTWPSQLFWLAITFLALYIVISRIAIPRTGGVIEKRKATISGDLAAAQKLKLDKVPVRWLDLDPADAHALALADTKVGEIATWGDAALRKVKPTVRIINAARGGIVNEDALAKALEEGRVAGAGIDVFAKEPTTDSPLFKFESVVVTPHLGASTDEAQEKAREARR